MRGKANQRKASNHRPVASSPQTHRLDAVERQMAEDLDWAETAAEVQQHEGQLVAVYRKRVIATGTDRDRLVAEAAAREACSPEDLVVVAVPRAGLWEIPR